MYVTAFGCGFCSAIVLLVISISTSLFKNEKKKMLCYISGRCVWQVSHVYISEIASPEIRGGLCAVAKVTSHVGLLVSFSLGAYLDWRRLAMVATAAPLALLIAALYIPETPSCLSLRGRDDQVSHFLSNWSEWGWKCCYFHVGVFFLIERNWIEWAQCVNIQFFQKNWHNFHLNWLKWGENVVNLMLEYFFLNWKKLNWMSPLSKWPIKKKNWHNFLSNWLKWLENFVISRLGYFFELKETGSIEPSV